MIDRCKDFIKVGDKIRLTNSKIEYTVISYQFIGKNEVALALQTSNGNTIYVTRNKHFVQIFDKNS